MTTSRAGEPSPEPVNRQPEPVNSQPDHYSTRRILLPSGRSMEIVRFDLDDASAPGLHICLDCGSHLVQPIAWAEAPQGLWELTLHCPDCDWVDEGVFDQDQLDALEEKLDAGLTEMLADLRRLTQSNMNEEIERFAAALRADFILPEDF